MRRAVRMRAGWNAAARALIPAIGRSAAAIACVVFAVPRGIAEPPQAGDDPVAARVDGHAIGAREVERELRTAMRGLDIAPDALDRLRSETLEKLIDRRLTLRYLEQKRLAASADDVELAWKRLEGELKGRGRAIDDYARQLGKTPEELRESMRWSLSWKAHLDRFLTDANVERYYLAHQRDFDGTERRVAHLLLRAESDERLPAILEKARSIRRSVVEGGVAFAAAVRESSESPTRESGGDLGWIRRREPMPESFSRSAFELEVGQVSEPVVTSFGVHLITCLDERRGAIGWKAARGELEKAMAAYLLTWSADQQRPSATVERTGVIGGAAPR